MKPENIPYAPETEFDPRRWRRLVIDDLPLYVQPEKPDWFVPSAAGDRILRNLAAGKPVGGDLDTYRFLQRLPASTPTPDTGPPPAPALRELWFHITNHCNQSCRHCLFSCGPDRREELAAAKITALADRAFGIGCRVFAITGGEPFVHPEIAAIIDHLLGYGNTHVAVLTNATLLQKFAADLDRWPADRFHLQVSVEGSRKTHDHLRGAGTFDRLRDTLHWLRERERPATLSMCVTENNVEQIPALAELAATVGSPNIHYMWYFVRGRGKRTEFVLPERIFPALVTAADSATAAGIGIDNLDALRTQVFAPTGTRHRRATAGWESAAVGPDGRLYPSAALVDIPALAGPIKNGDLAAAWGYSPVLGKIRAHEPAAGGHPLDLLLGEGDLDHSWMAAGTFGGDDPYRPLYERLALWLLAAAATRQPDDDAVPGLRLKMGDMLESCGAHGSEAFIHSNCLLALTLPSSRAIVGNFYREAAADPNSDILNPVDYPEDLVGHIPVASRVRSYGCGSPVLDAGLREGERLVDLGSGSGVECFIGARLVGPNGTVTGVDMLDPMLALATRGAEAVQRQLGYTNISFMKGFLEELPLDNDGTDVVISNCVINLSASKRLTFGEIFRVLVPGGRLVISDVVCETEPAAAIRNDETLRGECIAGALTQKDLFGILREAGFVTPRVLKRFPYRVVGGQQFYSITFAARKPVSDETDNTIRAMYRGPFAALELDDGRRLLPGLTVELSAAAAADCGEELFIFDRHGMVTNVDIGESACALPPEVALANEEKAGGTPAAAAAPATAEPAEKHPVDCMVCGAPLVYFERERELTCVYCGAAGVANAQCENGHFVCDRCHAEDALAIIEHLCVSSREKDMIALLDHIRRHPRVPMHGPEYHAMVPGIVLAGYRNAGGELSDEQIVTGIRRGSRVPGGFCGFYGVCGAAIGVGAAFG
ncbi:MAG: methyltransferase domain-containing protein, partial [Deltaproteobacteria bacterium]|nr:methyltransferase domain-containing protein [Candidatus Anaeroferrophillacea bacterium]